MKKIFVAALSLFIMLSLAVPCFADGYEANIVSVTEEVMDNGIVCTTTIYENPSILRDKTKNGSIRREYKYNGEIVASVVLNASFSYNGSTATMVTASGDHSVASGWTYSGQSIWGTGATAHLSATVSGPVTFPVSLSLTCSPTGVLS